MRQTPLEHIRGDTFKRSITIDDGTIPIDITWSTIVLTIRSDISSEDVLVSQNATLTDPTLGKCQIIVSAVAMDEVPPGNAIYDIQWTSAWGEKTTILIGPLNVFADVTQT